MAEKKQENNKNTQSVVIAVLATVIVCAVIVFVVLIATGVIKFGGRNSGSGTMSGGSSTSSDSGVSSGSGGSAGESGGRKLVENTCPLARVNDATAAIVGELTFYLPDDFDAGGKNSDGAFTYNLNDDDGWAQVLVYAEESDLSPQDFLMRIGPTLEITDMNYPMNGTTWVQAENGTSLAYATRLEDKIYAVYYVVKLDSDDTAEAMQMIPKTLYMARIYEQ